MKNEEQNVIFSYTRAQAIEDGILVDLMQGELGKLVKEAGFNFPIAMTATAFAATIIAEGQELSCGQSIEGRLWDVLNVLRFSIRKNRNSDRVNFVVSVFDGKRPRNVELWCLCGPGDTAEPVLTIMLQGED